VLRVRKTGWESVPNILNLERTLNQIAHHMNAGRGAPPDLSALLARIEAILDDIYGPGDNGGRAQL
jgi:hypothetical protein